MKSVIGLIALIYLFTGSPASAEIEEAAGDDSIGLQRAPAAVPSLKGVSRKRYAGGADEDDLQVQATLPIPSRTFDGSVAPGAAASGGEATSEPGESAPSATD